MPADPADGLIDRLASHLAPLFVTNFHDLPAARLMAVRTIASYQPETQADFINIARSISFSMSALAALRRAAAEDMPPALQLRYFGSANSLNRSADQSERTMERRRRYQQACTSPMPQTWTDARCASAAAGTVAVDAETGDRAGPEIGKARFADQGTSDPGIGDTEIAEMEVDEAAIEAAVAEAMLKYTTGRKPGSPVDGGVPQAASMLHRGVEPTADDADTRFSAFRHRISGGPRSSLHSTASRVSPAARPSPRACFAGDDTLRRPG
jgi:hypothetical protein